MRRGLNDHLMALAAIRYCLGRQSYIVGACVEWVRDNWHWIDAQTRAVVLRDIEEAIGRGEAGSPTDVREWTQLADGLRSVL